MNDCIYCLWLSLAVTPGSDSFKKLISKFTTAEEVYEADQDALVKCIGGRSKDLNSLCDKSLEGARKILNYCSEKNVGILTYFDDRFPNNLRNIENPPVLLYYRGILPDFNSQCFISLVGTRRLTDYGRRNAFYIGQDLGKCGVVVVSGMAIGIDGVGMAGALSSGASTVAFLGCGINICYPEGHITLAKEIVKNGCIMTEYPPDTRPNSENFPIRNRLISGISCATVVIEGGEKSGSMITARSAKKQGRAVYALPGNVDNKTSEVSNNLIKNGAKLITSAYDIIRDFEFVYSGKINPFKLNEPNTEKMNDVLSKFKVICVTHSDKEFRAYKSAKETAKETGTEKAPDESYKKEDSHPVQAVDEPKRQKSFAEAGFDKVAIQVYMKIPVDTAVSYSTLCDENIDMKSVMRALFQLDLGNFIEMLPGEKVKRK